MLRGFRLVDLADLFGVRGLRHVLPKNFDVQRLMLSGTRIQADLEFHSLPLLEPERTTNEAFSVHEDITAAFVRPDESETSILFPADTCAQRHFSAQFNSAALR